MTPRVTVLYEDTKYALHTLVLRMLEDEINGQTWKLRPLIRDNPRKGVDNVLSDVRVASLIAGPGHLFVVVDRDRLAAHVTKNARPGEPTLSPHPTDAELTDAVRATAGAHAPHVRVFLLGPNMEGLIGAIRACQPDLLPDLVGRALGKDLIARDLVLAEAGRAARERLRRCVRDAQPGLDALITALVEVVPAGLLA